MTRRHGPEDPDDEDIPLFRSTDASHRGHRRAEQAAGRASRLDAGWRSSALEAVRAHAERNVRFLAEAVARHVAFPDGSDVRAMGAIMNEARRLGYVEADGFGIDSFGSPKTAWKSLVYGRQSA